MRLPVLIVLFALSAPLSAQLTARVNDPNSPGTLGDPLLSLAEAFALVNGTLTPGQLSTGEFNQLGGIGSAVVTIQISQTVTPVITLQQQLPLLAPPAHIHADYSVDGVPNPATGARPIIDGGTVANIVLPFSTNHAHVHELSIRNGRVGVYGDPIGHYHPGEFMILERMDFSGQVDAAIKIVAPNDIAGRVMPAKINHVDITATPVGLWMEDLATNGTLNVEVELVHIEAAQKCFYLFVNAYGGISQVQTYRTDMINTQNCVQVRRDPNSDSEMLVRFVHGTMRAAHNVLDIEGNPNGNTIAHHHHLDMHAGPGANDYAVTFFPRTARFDIHGSENRVTGNVSILAGRSSRRLWQQNNVYTVGSMVIDNSGIVPDFLWNQFDGFPVTIASGNGTALSFESCELRFSSINGQSAIGPLTLNNCFVASSSTITGSVTNSNPAPAPYLGRATVLPQDPPVGGFVDLTVDLPANMGAFWLFGKGEPRPQTTTTNQFPYRLYLLPNPLIFLPGFYLNQQSLRLPLPNNPALVGVEMYAQPMCMPVGGQPYAPLLTMPIGGRIIPR